jgi:hypothetical protein
MISEGRDTCHGCRRTGAGSLGFEERGEGGDDGSAARGLVFGGERFLGLLYRRRHGFFMGWLAGPSKQIRGPYGPNKALPPARLRRAI